MQEQPELMAVLDKLLDRTWKAPLAAGYSGELQVLVDNLVLKNILALAASPRNAENVRGEAMLAINELGEWMKKRLPEAAPRQKAALYFGLSQIDEFGKDPSAFVPEPSLEMPPGAPIGMSDMY